MNIGRIMDIDEIDDMLKDFEQKATKENSRDPSLGGARLNPVVKKVSQHIVNQGAYLEITMNLPRTPTFLKADSDKQKALYTTIFNKTFNCIPMVKLAKHKEFIFEYCKSGQIHLHGYITLNDDVKYNAHGLISDLTKRYLECQPKKYSKFSENKMYTFDNGDTVCYKTDSLKLSWKNNQDSRFDEWLNYIQKAQ